MKSKKVNLTEGQIDTILNCLEEEMATLSETIAKGNNPKIKKACRAEFRRISKVFDILLSVSSEFVEEVMERHLENKEFNKRKVDLVKAAEIIKSLKGEE